MLDAVKNLIFPNVCVNCESILDRSYNLCDECNRKINFLTGHYCNVCGAVIAHSTYTCGKCIFDPPQFKVLRSAFAYDQHSKGMILRFKFFDNLSHVKVFAKWMYNANQDIFKDVKMIIPVPLHRLRLFKRKYNQAALLAKELSRLSNLFYAPFIIKRVRNTCPQSGLPLQKREKNLKKAFNVFNKETIKDSVIILIDDVVTTGATVRSCAKEMISSGAREVRVLTLARTIG